MCAIAGMIGLVADDRICRKMLETMKRRGPDDKGIYQQGLCTLLHTRLAIVDPEGGRQPMVMEWAGETYVLVYNGELYNTEELRTELIRCGHRFAGYSDTEVVLHAYVQWRDKCVEKMNGIFAFGVWENKGDRLFLARDRIGVKPLFYTLQKDGLLFASEIKTLLCHGAVKPRLDEQGAAQLILLGPGRMPGSGIFKDILELEPGCCGYYENGRFRVYRYWKLRDREHRETFDETVECVRYLVTDAIRRQMVSDVPVGTFLSGGLDSSIITAVCAQEMASKNQQLHTFSVDYLNNDRYFRANKFQPDADGDYIREMETALQTRHHWTVLNTEDLVDQLESATVARDLPGMADVDFSLLAFCKDIRREVKVALSGECADEIFGGYPWYRDPEIRSQQGFPWAQNIDQRAGLLSGAISERLDPVQYIMDAYRMTCRESDILPGTSDQERRMKEMVNLNFRWFMQTLLDRKDRMSMYHSLEVRVPFCDYRIAEYLYGVPWAFKDHKGREKGLLREAVKDLLPDKVLHRKKSPYPKTFDPEYETCMIRKLRNILEGGDSPLFSIVDREALNSLLEADAPWPWYGQLMRRPQTIAYFLQMEFWLRHYQVEICY